GRDPVGVDVGELDPLRDLGQTEGRADLVVCGRGQAQILDRRELDVLAATSAATATATRVAVAVAVAVTVAVAGTRTGVVPAMAVDTEAASHAELVVDLQAIGPAAAGLRDGRVGRMHGPGRAVPVGVADVLGDRGVAGDLGIELDAIDDRRLAPELAPVARQLGIDPVVVLAVELPVGVLVPLERDLDPRDQRPGRDVAATNSLGDH